MVTPDMAATEHQGQLVAEYRKNQKWSRAKLAEVLHVDVSTIYRMEKQSVIKDPKRRQLLVGLLGIPATLLGVGSASAPVASNLALNNDHMAFFEEQLASRWDIYHTGGTTRAYRGLDVWLREIESFARQAAGSAWHKRAQTTLNMSYQLQGSIFRDMMRYNLAHHSYQQAFRVAQELDDPELMASVNARQGVTFIQQQEPIEAITYLNSALKLANGSGLPALRGYILQAFSEAYAMSQQGDESRRNIDLAQRALERRGEVLERTYCQLNTTSVISQKGVNAVLLHDNDYAIRLLDKGLATYDPTLIRGRARLIAQKAEAYYGLGWLDASVTTAEEALNLARSVGSQKQIARVQSLHTTMVQSRWGNENYIARLGAALALR